MNEKYRLFRAWVHEHHNEATAQQYLDQYAQSGDYPEEFINDWMCPVCEGMGAHPTGDIPTKCGNCNGTGIAPNE